MKRFLTLTIGLFLGTIITTLANATTLHDNIFSFYAPTCATAIDSATFSLKKHAITKGQPWRGVSRDRNNPDAIDVKAGRHKSAAVATTSKKWIKFKQTSISGSVPDELNFAILGDLTLKMKDGKKYVLDDMYLGQGSSDHIFNLWWIAGKNCHHLTNHGSPWVPTNKMSCRAENGESIIFYNSAQISSALVWPSTTVCPGFDWPDPFVY